MAEEAVPFFLVLAQMFRRPNLWITLSSLFVFVLIFMVTAVLIIHIYIGHRNAQIVEKRRHKAPTTVCHKQCQYVWTNWSDCSVTCGQGYKRRFGKGNRNIRNEFFYCPTRLEWVGCESVPCIVRPVYSFNFSQWRPDCTNITIKPTEVTATSNNKNNTTTSVRHRIGIGGNSVNITLNTLYQVGECAADDNLIEIV